MRDPYRRPARLAAAAVGLLAVAVSVLAAPAAPASAKIVEKWGFIHSDAPVPSPATTVMDRQWGSWKTAFPNEWASVTKIETGLYRVRFPHLASRNGVAHVTAVGAGPISCQVVNTNPYGDAQFVHVRCFGPGGKAVDAGFNTIFTEKLIPTGSGTYGYLLGRANGGVGATYNSSGAVNDSNIGGVGVYKAWLPGLGGTDFAGNLQVTAVSTETPVRCKVGRWLPQSTGQVVYVLCHGADGHPVNSDWYLTYHHKVSTFGEGFPPKHFAYIWDTLGGLPPGTNVNSTGGVNQTFWLGDSMRQILMPGVGTEPSHVQITAEGTDNSYCNITSWMKYGEAALLRGVACYNTAGNQTKSRYFASYTSAH
jgi:hypothetical protein